MSISVRASLSIRTLYADVTAQTKLTDLDYDYDALGNVLSQLENWPGSALRPIGWRVTTMTYDDSNRLETETVSQSATPESLPGAQLIRTVYSYDAANNRQTKTVLGGDEPGFWDYNYNSVNQLKTWAKFDHFGGVIQKSASLEYDLNGNRKSQALTAVGSTQTTIYQWDAQNRLMGVTLPDAPVWTYAYDYRTRRISATRSGGGQSGKVTSIVFAGGLSLAEWEQSGTTASPILNTPPTVEYTRGPDMGGGVGGLLYSLRSGAPKFNLSNGRGDIIAQSDAAGELTWTASYEAYGKRTTETGTNADKQRANSKDEDPTGLLNEGFRYRDIETGVWLSRDPAGFVDGPNLYAYVRQNPWTKFDPDGLESEPVNMLEFFAGGSETFKGDTSLEKGVRKAAAKPENAKRLVVGIHGTAKAVQDSNTKKMHGEKWLAKQIKEHPFFEQADSVLMLSCNTGNTNKESNPIAGRVAKRLEKEVEAPSDYGWIAEDGRYGSAPAKPKSKEQTLGQVELDYSKPSKMNIFDKQGKLNGGTPTEDGTKPQKTSLWQRVKSAFKKKSQES